MERHDLDATSLVSGILFVVLGTLFLSEATGAFELDVRWVWPALLIGLGVAFLASSRNGATPSDEER